MIAAQTKRRGSQIYRAHSFSADRGISSRTAEFGFLRAEPRNFPRNFLPFARGFVFLPRNWFFPRALTFFIRTTQKMASIVIVISKLLKRYSTGMRTRAPAYSRALRRIKGGFPKGVKTSMQVAD